MLDIWHTRAALDQKGQIRSPSWYEQAHEGIQGQAGQGPEQRDLVEDVPAHRWPATVTSNLHYSMILWFYDSMILWFKTKHALEAGHPVLKGWGTAITSSLKKAGKIKTTLASNCLTRTLFVPAHEQWDTRAFVPTTAANRVTTTLGE